MSTRVSEINTDIIKKCRFQLGFSLSEVANKVKNIGGIEDRSYTPTLNDLDNLAKLYSVPRWVFISPELPSKYDFSNAIAFRHFSQRNPSAFSNVKVRAITSRVSKLRDLLLELLEDLDDDLEPFLPPLIGLSEKAEDAAEKVRSWLEVGHQSHTFLDWKDILEKKGLFVFLTSKYLGWSHIKGQDGIRGFSIYHDIRPIILVNSTDWKNAQSFTLFHELAHILRKESSLDSWESSTRTEEVGCDDFAGALLVPQRLINTSTDSLQELSEIKKEAKKFKVSAYVYLIRIRRLNLIDQKRYLHLEGRIRKEFLDKRDQLGESKTKISRNRVSEIIQQYGQLLTSTLYQAYHNEILDLKQLTRILDVKNVHKVFEIGSKL